MRPAFGAQPVGFGDRLDEGGLPGSVLTDDDGEPGEVQAIVQYVADRGDGGGPTVAVRRFYLEFLDPTDGERSVAAEGQWRRVVRGTVV